MFKDCPGEQKVASRRLAKEAVSPIEPKPGDHLPTDGCLTLFGLPKRCQIFLPRDLLCDSTSVAPGIPAHPTRTRFAISIAAEHLRQPEITLAREQGLGLLQGSLLDPAQVMAAQSAF